MRICLANLDFGAYHGSGLAVMGDSLARGLAATGHEVTVVARGRPEIIGPESEQGIAVIRTPVSHGDWLGYAWYAGPLVRDLHRRKPFDIVHFVDVHFAWRYRGPYIASLHQSFTQRLSSGGSRPAHVNWRDLAFRAAYYRLARHLVERPCLRRAAHLIAVSRTTAEAFVAEGAVARSRVSVVHNGIDLHRMVRTDPSPLRQRLSLSPQQRVLLFVGFCGARKGLIYLARALPLLPSNVHVVIVGRWDPAYRARFEEAVRPLTGRVSAVGYVEDDELPLYYSLADLFVSPTLLEGFGLPIVEALACGTPVVTTNAGATAEVGGPGALIVPPGDHVALAEAINALLADEPARLRLARSGQEWARAQFSQEAMVAGYLAVYERCRQTFR